MRKLTLVILLLHSSIVFAQQSALADTLAKMVITDQKAAGLPPANISLSSPEWLQFKDSVFTSHYYRLKEFVSNNGYPGYNLVGKEGSHNFWLLVQHLDKWPDFQQKILIEMEKQVQLHNASPADFAYLTDRVRLNTGQQQVYGTQVTYNTDSCQAIPRPLENPTSVNERRKSVELNSIETYLNQMSESHFRMNQHTYEEKGIKGPKLYKVL
jgi:hypothetical protein